MIFVLFMNSKWNTKFIIFQQCLSCSLIILLAGVIFKKSFGGRSRDYIYDLAKFYLSSSVIIDRNHVITLLRAEKVSLTWYLPHSLAELPKLGLMLNNKQDAKYFTTPDHYPHEKYSKRNVIYKMYICLNAIRYIVFTLGTTNSTVQNILVFHVDTICNYTHDLIILNIYIVID